MKKCVVFFIFALITYSFESVSFAEDSKIIKGRPVVATPMSPLCPIWQENYNDPFPIRKFINDLSDLGVTDIFFFAIKRDKTYYPSKVFKHRWKPAAKRDFLEEILAEADKKNMRVWIYFNEPYQEKGKFMGFRHPKIINRYRAAVKEIAENYGHHPSLTGFKAHELNGCESRDNHNADLQDFKDFCKKKFGEEFQGDKIPVLANPENKWWRRYYLYKNHCMTSLVKAIADEAKRYNLKTGFCYYLPEGTGSSSWCWGYDPVALEEICDLIWIGGLGELPKIYYHLQGIMPDFGPSYKRVNLPKIMCHAFHGKPLSFFEYSSPLYVKEMLKYYGNNKIFTKRYGHFYFDLKEFSQKDLDLFHGKKNMKNWIQLMTFWQQGKSAAKIAVAGNTVPFVLRHPDAPGNNNQCGILMSNLTRHFDVDGILLGSKFALDPDKLKEYSLIIIPPKMGEGMSKQQTESLRQYLKTGGKLLVCDTPLIQSLPDLTKPQNLTDEFCGIQIKGEGAGGYIKTEGELKNLPDKKFWASVTRVEHKNTKILVKNNFTGDPLLIKKNNVYFCTIEFAETSIPFYANVVGELVKSPVSLTNSTGIRIIESTVKNDVLCVSLFDQGEALLKINTQRLGLKGQQFQVKNILTGKVLHEADSAGLLKGVNVEIKNLNEPCVLAIGLPQKMEQFKGIYPATEDFSNMNQTVATVENPQEQIIVPNKPGLKVGIYHGGWGTKMIHKVLNQQDNINCFLLPRLDYQCLNACDVVIVPHPKHSTFYNRAIKILRQWVENGGGMLLTHCSVGLPPYTPLCPEIVENAAKLRRKHTLTITRDHPITEGFKTGETFIPAFMFDYITMKVGDKADVLATGDNNSPVIVTSKPGKGKIVLNGTLPGMASPPDSPVGTKDHAPAGIELKMLLNTINWLAKKGNN